ncbi:pimeloyl-ACP methyl ester carboxylesterase [Mycobacterium sp. OAS707]|uniref:alpha/beta hydrolase n=1 Tax=Mycobacterium sp. OAS707 TaxID=2663822 RepID=UPI00178C12B6|nr:pimeloyl-ACP methyl ester carboxylesterase [Mycobacterium sp. OAS707]
MVNRLMALLGIAVVLMAIAAGLLAGAASAAADTGSDAGDGTKTSESTQESTSRTESEKPVKPAEQPKKRKTRNPTAKSNKPHTEKADASDAEPAAKTVKPAAAPHETATTAIKSGARTAKAPAAVEAVRPTEVSESTTLAVTEQAAAPRKPTLLNFVGSIAMNVVMGLIHTFDGAPVLPAGSTVTVRTSTLRIPVAGGRTVQADWYFPDDGETPTRLIYFQHGLGASGPMYSYTAATLAEQTNSIVVAPSLTSNFFDIDGAWLGGAPMQQAVADLFVGERAELTESASAAAGHEVELPTHFALAGHSLGGSLVMGAAADMIDNGAIDDLAGVLLLDSVDVNNSVPSALQKLTGVNYRPVYDISSERYVWNMYGKVGDELQAARPGQFTGVMLVGGRHIDALQGGNPIMQLSQYLIAGFSQPQNVEAVKTLAVGWVNDMFAGTHDGIYGAPQQSIQIDTTAGTATAVVLPFASTQRVQGTPFDGVVFVVLDFMTKFFVYEPLAAGADLVAT